LSYRANGTKRQFTIAPYGALSFDEAREQARTKLAKVIGGGDPVAARKAVRAVGPLPSSPT
jgi:hypothetical protein